MRHGTCSRLAMAGVVSLAFTGAAPLWAQSGIRTTGRLYASTPTPLPPPEVEQAPIAEPLEPVSEVEPVQEVHVQEGPSVDEGGRLDLMCFGRGAANKTDLATAFGTSTLWSPWGSASGSSTATIVGRRSQGFEDQVSLYIEGDQGRLRMPRTMLPMIRGGEDGWFRLEDIEIKRNEITASVAVNIINNPKLRLDRYTGAISISGKAGDYAGDCRRFDPAAAEREF